MRASTLLALAASLSPAAAVYQGFNYGTTNSDGSFKFQADFQSAFQTAKNLVGTSGFTSARLYTMIQGGSSTNEPTQAIPAAIAEGVSLLLGIWASAGDGQIEAELTALNTAISKYGSSFTSLVAGISVGSEDLYRISPTGIAAKSGAGADPATLASYISQVKSALAGTALSASPVGHVDTWTAWVNGSNQAVIDASDWIGMDAYPYFQNTQSNGIENGQSLFNDALSATQAAVGGKEVWITETGWPVSGSTENLAVPSLANAKTYWDEVGCANFGKVNTWWFTLQDADPVTPNPSFGIIGSTLSTTPLYDLTCSAVTTSSSSTTQASTSSSSSPAQESTSSTQSPAQSTSSTQSPAQESTSSQSPSQESTSTEGSSSGTSSVASPAPATATSAIVSSGGGLTPSEGAGNGIGSSPSPSGSTAGNGSTTSGLQTSTTSSAAGTGASVVSSNQGNALAGSLVGAIGAIFVAVAAL